MLELLLVAAATSTPAVERVLLVSIDGLRTDAVTTLGSERTPNLHRLIREGASTLNARTDRTLTVTVPNHVCMVTSRPSSGANGHGYRTNGYGGLSVHEVKRRYVASVFDAVKAAGFRVAMAASKPKFELLRKSYASVLDQATISFFDDRQTLEATMGLLGVTTPPRFIFVHFAGADVQGHTTGFDVGHGSDYLREVQRQDRLLGRILFAIEARGSLTKTTALIVTSDHGGFGRFHSDASRVENFRIPFVVWGPGVSRGADLYEINRGRADPGDKPRAQGAPISNCEAGNLVLSLLGLLSIPGSVVNARQDLRY